MDKFVTLLDEYNIANQIAFLLNSYNKLSKIHTGYSILGSNITYFIEQGVLDGKTVVVGCVGVDIFGMNSMFLKHLSIHPTFRRLGIASKLLKKAQAYCFNMLNVYMNIRSDNFASLSLAEKEGFLVMQIKNQKDYNIVTVGKINEARKQYAKY